MLFQNRLDKAHTNAIYKLSNKYLYIRTFIRQKIFKGEKIDNKVLLELADTLSELTHVSLNLFMNNNLKGVDNSVVEEAKLEIEKIVGETIIDEE